MAEVDVQTAGPAAVPRRSVRLLQVAVAVLLALRLWLAFGVAPIGDEAYYWLWGQNLDLSYYDHPPLNAWLMGLSGQLFGWNLFALRAPGWLTTAATVFLIYKWSRLIHGADWERLFWIGLVAYFASPLFFIYSAMMFMDHLLVPLVLWSLLHFARFLAGWEAGTPRWRELYLAAFVLGLAALTKYNAVFLAAGVAAYVMASPRLRTLLLRPQLYGAALLTLLMLAPIVIWNLQHGLASMNYNLVERQSGLFNPSLEQVQGFLLESLIYLSPFLLWPLFKVLLRTSAGPGLPSTTLGLGRATFVVSTLAVLALAAGGNGTGPYWNIIAYAALVPLLAPAIGARVQLALHFAYGVIVIGLLGFNFGVAPVAALVTTPNWDSAIVHGWDQVKSEVDKAEAKYRPDFLAATRYTLAAQLAFARGRDDVTDMSPRTDQFDFWWQPEQHIGQTALILSDATHRIDSGTAASFATIEEVGRFEIVRLGRVINTFTLSLARGYRGAPQR